MNKLFYGDNLDVLRKYIKDETIDLCYIDPPFNSKRNYNQIYNNVGKEDKAQAQAFIDTWTWDTTAELGYAEITSNYNGVFTVQSVELIMGLSKVLGKGSLLAYLVSMTLRIAEIYRVLKPTGSFYFHCDPTASHYLKIIIDAIFCSRKGEMQNEIIWKRTFSHGGSKRYGPIHDVILYYTKSDTYTWKTQYSDYDQSYLDKFFIHEDGYGRKYRLTTLTGSGLRNGASGQPWRGINPTDVGRHWAVPGYVKKLLPDPNVKNVQDALEALNQIGRIAWASGGKGKPSFKQYMDDLEGTPVPDVWTNINPLSAQSAERLGYPTQKPEALLERIIQASSNEGDTILDAYCGCGTTIAVAQKLNRNWIGIDITYQSIALMLKRLEDSFGKNILENITLNGVPQDMESAVKLANKQDDRTRKEFEKWAVLTYSNNRAIINEKKGGDGGIDGIAYMVDRNDKHENENKQVLFSVKSNQKLSPTVIRDLNGTVEREGAAMGIFITLYPMENLVKESKQYGMYTSKFNGQIYPRITVVSVEEILKGQRLNIPTALEVLKKAERKQEGQEGLGF